MVHYLSNHHHLQIIGVSFFVVFKKKFPVCTDIIYTWAKVMYVQ